MLDSTYILASAGLALVLVVVAVRRRQLQSAKSISSSSEGDSHKNLSIYHANKGACMSPVSRVTY